MVKELPALKYLYNNVCNDITCAGMPVPREDMHLGWAKRQGIRGDLKTVEILHKNWESLYQFSHLLRGCSYESC